MDSKDAVIKKIVYDDDKIRNVIKNAPQSYNSILQHHKDNGTMQVVLRRRISRLVKKGSVWKLRIPGTRWGVALFCTPEHDYKIIVVDSLIGVKIYYFFEFKDYDTYITIDDYWEMNTKGWCEWNYKNIPLKIKKYRCLRLWE